MQNIDQRFCSLFSAFLFITNERNLVISREAGRNATHGEEKRTWCFNDGCSSCSCWKAYFKSLRDRVSQPLLSCSCCSIFLWTVSLRRRRRCQLEEFTRNGNWKRLWNAVWDKNEKNLYFSRSFIINRSNLLINVCDIILQCYILFCICSSNWKERMKSAKMWDVWKYVIVEGIWVWISVW